MTNLVAERLYSEQLYSHLIKQCHLMDIRPHSARLESDVKTILRVANKLKDTDYEDKILELIHYPFGFDIPEVSKKLKLGEIYTKTIKYPGTDKLSWDYVSAFESGSITNSKSTKKARLVEKVAIKRNGRQMISVWSYTSHTRGKVTFISTEVYDNSRKQYCTLIISSNNETFKIYHKGKIENMDRKEDRGGNMPKKIDFEPTFKNIMDLVSGAVPEGFEAKGKDFAGLFVSASETD